MSMTHDPVHAHICRPGLMGLNSHVLLTIKWKVNPDELKIRQRN